MARRIIQIAVASVADVHELGEARVEEGRPQLYALDDQGAAWKLDEPAAKWEPLPLLPAELPRAD